MSKGPEARFKDSINKLIKGINLDVHIEGMANPYRRGTPDVYYEGKASHLWVEYKFLKAIPKILDLTSTNILSPHQQRWLSRAVYNKQPVAVVVGFPEGGVILEGSAWKAKHTKENVLKNIKIKQTIAQEIVDGITKTNECN